MNKGAKVEGRNNDSNMSKKIEKARDVIGKELCATNNNNNNCGDNQNNNHACIIPPHDRGPYNYVPLPAPRCGEVTPPIDNESCLPPFQNLLLFLLHSTARWWSHAHVVTYA